MSSIIFHLSIAIMLIMGPILIFIALTASQATQNKIKSKIRMGYFAMIILACLMTASSGDIYDTDFKSIEIKKFIENIPVVG